MALRLDRLASRPAPFPRGTASGVAVETIAAQRAARPPRRGSPGLRRPRSSWGADRRVSRAPVRASRPPPSARRTRQG
eukprot:scaffold39257_cov30-Tisochrysis_lutea.AAC.4